MRRFGRRVLCTLLALSALACGGDGKKDHKADGGQETGTQAEQSIEIWTYWTSPSQVAAMQRLVDLYQERNPNVRIVRPSFEGDLPAYSQGLDTRLIAGNPPEIVASALLDLGPRVRRPPGKFAPLDELYDEIGLRQLVADEITESLTADDSVQRAVFAIPLTPTATPLVPRPCVKT